MNVDTGEYRRLAEEAQTLEGTMVVGFDAAQLREREVLVVGTDAQVERLSQAVKGQQAELLRLSEERLKREHRRRG